MNNEIKSIEKINEESTAVIEHAEKFEIKKEGDLAPVIEFRDFIKKNRIKILKEHYDQKIKDAYIPYKNLLNEKKEKIKPFETAIKIADSKLSDWQEKQYQIRQEKERKAREEAERLEQKRQQALREQAEKWREKGNEEKARERERMAEEFIAPVEIPADMTKTIKTESGAGITTAKDLEIQVINKTEVLKSVIAGKLPIGCVDFKMGVIKTHVKNNEITSVPGIQIRTKFITRSAK